MNAYVRRTSPQWHGDPLKRPISLTVDTDIFKWLEVQAIKSNISNAEYIRTLIRIEKARIEA